MVDIYFKILPLQFYELKNNQEFDSVEGICSILIEKVVDPSWDSVKVCFFFSGFYSI